MDILVCKQFYLTAPDNDHVVTLCRHWPLVIVWCHGIFTSGLMESRYYRMVRKAPGVVCSHVISKRRTFNQCWFDVGSASATLTQHQTSIGLISRMLSGYLQTAVPVLITTMMTCPRSRMRNLHALSWWSDVVLREVVLCTTGWGISVGPRGWHSYPVLPLKF